MSDMQFSPKQIAVGLLMAAAILVLLFAAVPSARAQTLTTLYSFGTQGGDGADPMDGVIFDKQGNLYGTTQGGGAYDSGTVFELIASGTEKVLHSFHPLRPPPISTGFRRCWKTDGYWPESGLVMDARGNLYGTTEGGGCGFGTVFEVTAWGKEIVLYAFDWRIGESPGPLVFDAQRNLYGTADSGGTYDLGTVFELTASGTARVLYSFTGTPDGAYPSGLVCDAEGNLYGTTGGGGTYGYGTVFELTASGTEKVLYSFTGGADGAWPAANLVLDAQGNLYGTTAHGGDLSDCSPYGCGTVFELTASGTEKVFYSFTGGTDGSTPIGGLVFDAQGILYGTTVAGGYVWNCGPNGYGCGTVFKLAPDGTKTVLWTFAGNDGQNPLGPIVLDAQGNLYGTTWEGGAYGYGTVFKLTP